MFTQSQQSAARSILQNDILRTNWHPSNDSTTAGATDTGHKEWHHFIVYAPGMRVLVNLSLLELGWVEGRPAKTQRSARVIAIAETDGWRGDVDAYRPGDVEAQAGGLDIRIGDNRMWFEEGQYHLRFGLKRAALKGELAFTPLTQPAVSHHIRLAAGRELSWLMLPRLAVSGHVRVGERRIQLNNALGYHDHNWGHFAWGDDFAWEWGSIVPSRSSNPWSAVYARMTDRNRGAVRTQGLFLWNGSRQARFFRDRDMTVTLEGRTELSNVFKLPPLVGLLASGTCTDVPRRLVAHAACGRDEVLLTFHTNAVSQVVIPNETTTDGVTTLNEASGSVVMSGTVDGQPMDLEGAGVFEFIRG